MDRKQVSKDHYDFGGYLSKSRWASIWHQIAEVNASNPDRVLEIGPGIGVFKLVQAALGVKVETVDLDPELNPDHICSVTSMPFDDSTYDVVCAFQMLEHLPYNRSLSAFKEMVRVSRGNVVISLPDAKAMYRYRFDVPKLGEINILIPRPRIRLPVHNFDGEHYWEINKKGYLLEKVIGDFSRYIPLRKTFRVPDFPYHRFFCFQDESDEC